MSTLNFEIKFPSEYEVPDKENDNIDVEVVLQTGEVYVGTLFTLENIFKLKNMKEHSKYLWASDMVIVDNLESETIHNCIAGLIADGIIHIAFTKCLS